MADQHAAAPDSTACVAALASWAFLVTIHHRNAGITTGGDYLAQILLFFCALLDTGAAFSIDARFRGKARDFVAAAPFRAMQLHLATLYFVTARLKIRGGWLDGHGIYLSLQHKGFLRPLGAFLLEHPSFCQLSTWIVLLLEGAFAFLAFCPIYGRRTRLLAAGCALMVQLGVLSTMRVGMFTPLMLWVNVLFLPAVVRPSATRALQQKRWLFVAACNALVVLMAWGAFVGKRWPMPKPVESVQLALGLAQPFDLFGATYEVAQWQATGQSADGRRVEVLSRAEPGFQSKVSWWFSRYYKLTFAPDADHAAIAQWLCRQYADETSQTLQNIRLWKRAHAPVRPGEATSSQDVTLYEGPCSAALPSP